MNRKVLVTGGAGYIGSHTCQALAAVGYLPVVFDNLSTGTPANVLFGPLLEGDIRDPAALQAAFALHQPVAVLHFAALISVPESVTNPAAYYDTNTHGAWQVLEALRTYNAQNNQAIPFIFSSTAAVYGIPTQAEPVTEATPCAPINPYGHSKHMVEQLLADYASAYGLNSIALRYFNAAGASLEATLGLRLPQPPHLIPACFEAILGTRPPLDLYGTDYPTPDGTAVRDYIHVADLATAHVLALESLLAEGRSRGQGGHAGGSSQVLNLGTGTGFSVKQVLQEVEKATGHAVPSMQKPRRAGDPPALVANASLAQVLLKWQPQYSSLASIIRTGWAWRNTL